MTDASAGGGTGFLVGAADPSRTATPEDLGEAERRRAAAVEEFAEREVQPLLGALGERDPATTRALVRRAAELDLFRAEVPTEDGGLGLGLLAVLSMLSPRAPLGPLAPLIASHQGLGTLLLAYFGSPAQKARYLGRCMDGTLVCAFAMTESESGSDAMSIGTRAVLDATGTHYVLNGTKAWVTNAGWAGVFIVFAKVDGTRFTAFLVDRDAPGLSVAEPARLLGEHGASVCAVSLEGVRVPAESVLGGVGKGYTVAFSTLNTGRLKLAVASATGAKRALAVASRFAAERVRFGIPIARFGVIQRMLAEMAAQAFAAESVVYRTAGLVDGALDSAWAKGPLTPDARAEALSEHAAECALAKVYASEAYHRLADDAVQAFGASGLSEDYAPAAMYRDARVARVVQGTNEICRLHAQRTLLKRLAAGGPEFRALPACTEILERLRALWGAPPKAPAGDPAPPLHAITGLRIAYYSLLEDALATVGADALKGPERQAILASLADVAMEVYAAESAALRAAKLEGSGTREEREVRAALASLALARADARVRSEARTILAEVWPAADAARRLAELDAILPVAHALIPTRARVAAWLTSRGGFLPGEAR